MTETNMCAGRPDTANDSDWSDAYVVGGGGGGGERWGGGVRHVPAVRFIPRAGRPGSAAGTIRALKGIPLVA